MADYLRYRPGYPKQIIETLWQRCGLTPASTIADIGSGTGLLAEPFLRNGNTVYGVEPNAEMRHAAESELADYDNFISVSGTAENTTLSDQSIDFLTAGQAFHWFDADRANVEFRRILRPSGYVVLIWNDREIANTPFQREYEELLRRYCPEYGKIGHRSVSSDDMAAFFGRAFTVFTFPNAQLLDYDGLKGRLLSSSYAPKAGQPNHEQMVRALHRLFERHEQDGHISVDYTTRMYIGKLG